MSVSRTSTKIKTSVSEDGEEVLLMLGANQHEYLKDALRGHCLGHLPPKEFLHLETQVIKLWLRLLKRDSFSFDKIMGAIFYYGIINGEPGIENKIEAMVRKVDELVNSDESVDLFIISNLPKVKIKRRAVQFYDTKSHTIIFTSPSMKDRAVKDTQSYFRRNPEHFYNLVNNQYAYEKSIETGDDSGH